MVLCIVEHVHPVIRISFQKLSPISALYGGNLALEKVIVSVWSCQHLVVSADHGLPLNTHLSECMRYPKGFYIFCFQIPLVQRIVYRTHALWFEFKYYH